MKFRPSYYAQQQLTSYAPSANYPGFYGSYGVDYDANYGPQQPVAPAEEEKDSETIFEWLNAQCDKKFADDFWKRGGCKTAVATARLLGAAALQKLAEKYFGKKVSTADTAAKPPSSTTTLPSNLTASEKALLDKCKKKPVYEQPACVLATVRKITADREAAKKSGSGAGGNTVWWVLGTLAAAGAVGGIWYATSKRRRA